MTIFRTKPDLPPDFHTRWGHVITAIEWWLNGFMAGVAVMLITKKMGGF